jgi:hypothetical protein
MHVKDVIDVKRVKHLGHEVKHLGDEVKHLGQELPHVLPVEELSRRVGRRGSRKRRHRYLRSALMSAGIALLSSAIAFAVRFVVHQVRFSRNRGQLQLDRTGNRTNDIPDRRGEEPSVFGRRFAAGAG